MSLQFIRSRLPLVVLGGLCVPSLPACVIPRVDRQRWCSETSSSGKQQKTVALVIFSSFALRVVLKCFSEMSTT